jgi:hypothetical protein
MSPPAPSPGLSAGQRRQIVVITTVALAVFLFFRLLPTGTNLNHMDFRVSGKNSVDFCDPANPQFIPVVAARSPVKMTLKTEGPPKTGEVRWVTLTLVTAGGKPIAPDDLLVMHEKKLHLLITDPTLTEYQHVHPAPTLRPGEWSFLFTPRRGGMYRFFADFTPAATARSLYANADLEVAGVVHPPVIVVGASPDGLVTSWTAEQGGYRFSLDPASLPVRARQVADLKFSVKKIDGGPVPLAPVMAAYAHLVAFDVQRSGFAHLHPLETDLTRPPDATHPTLAFKITIPEAGRYVIWAQVSLAGSEVFVPFWFEVAP